MKETSETNVYDESPYPSRPYSQTHPRHLATIATLFGIQPKLVSDCRVLEIGCSDGSNLIPMACEFPNSQFVGVDLSSRQIKNAKQTVETLKLKNIDLRYCNILDVDDSFGKYDYIIAHGIYSWVPDDVQKHLLKLCKHRLNNQGIAYISYNTYPGWKMRGLLRDMMLYHANNFEDTPSKITQAKALINFLSETVPVENNAYGTLLRNELKNMKNWDDNYFLHESLEEVNDPVYFYQFIEKAKQQGLQYLAESEVHNMITGNFDARVKETLDKIGTNIIQREQYMDFIRNRMFRQTLLCHDDISLTRGIDVENISSMNMSSNCEAVTKDPDLTSNAEVEFKVNNLHFSSECPYTKCAVNYLGSIWPEYISFQDILEKVGTFIDNNLQTKAERNEDINDVDLFATKIFNLYAKNIIDLSLYPPTVTKTISKNPVIGPIACLQAQTQDWTTNQLHQVVDVDVISKHLLPLLDGQHDDKKIRKHLLKLIQNGTLQLQLDGVLLEDNDEIMDNLDEYIKTYLNKVSKSALLEN